MREIGGYFELEKHISNQGEYYKNLIALNTARNALAYLIKARRINKIYIPYMLCDSISRICDREYINYEYYLTDQFFKPVFAKILKENEYIFIVNLYGQINNEEIVYYKEKYQNIIIDNTHAFFQEPVKDVDTIYSCRKFFGVPDGSYLYSNVKINKELDVDNSDNRISHIYGRFNDGASAHYDEYKKNEEIFNKLDLMQMSNLTHEMLRKIDYEKIKQIRTENYKYLYNKLVKLNKLKLKLIDGAFAYPFYIKNGMEIKKKLATKGIYIPTLWPNVLELPDSMLAKDFAENILPLPCDQRYNIGDMQLIVDEIINTNRS